MGRCQALMSVEAASGGSPDDGGRTHRMQRGVSGARAGAAAAAATLLPARQSAARHRPECCSSCAPQHLRLMQRSMLQQMSSTPSAQVGELASVFPRYLEGRAGGDVSSEASSDAAEDLELPECKIKRNYNCTKCTFYTQNPRAFLVHTRDAHFVKLKIFDCPHCVYASKHHQKLIRHIKMVHEEGETRTPKSSLSVKLDVELPTSVEHDDQVMRIEDMLEEVEDCEDMIEIDEGPDLPMEQVDDIDVVGDFTTEQSAPSNLLKTKNNVKFFTCDKCTYVTHIRARFTKHVKYHSMPMIKCTMCDFRTPYKWNLDRHMKNHGGSGSFHCSMCNFTADIKQSLTVHEMNHHTPAAGQSLSSRRRNRVGASDTVIGEYDTPSAALPREEEGSGDSRSSHVSEMGLQYADRELVSCKSDSNDGSHSDATGKRDSNGSPNHSSDESKQKQSRKVPRPIPQLIPLNSSTPNNQKPSSTGEPPQKKFKESSPVDLADSNSDKIESLPADITLIPVNNTSGKEGGGRKKNESFFDRLKERLLAETGQEGSLVCKNCGFESKCLSEHSVHEKNCTPQANRTTGNASHSSLSSTRCQNCRHRCKSSADLYIHMKTCGKSEKNDNDNISNMKNDDSNDTSTTNQDKELERHPMENVVFVWNNINQENNKFDTPLGININDDSTLPGTNRSFDIEIINDENESMNLSPSQAVGRKVFKCPHCPFFSTTASRFHVHIVGHLNKKPFECSLCKYKSNWRWDITKHIKLKSARDPEHNEAKVLMTDETGRRNYSKYNKFLAMPVLNEYGENQFHYLDSNPSIDGSMEIDDSFHDMSDVMNPHYEIQPLNLQTQYGDEKYDVLDGRGLGINDMKKPKKTLWKCKKCNYKDASKEALLEHVREHSKDGIHEEGQKPAAAKKSDNTPDPADLAYRCGHCHQLSNWKHVIQRHCRLKHDGVIKVITTVKPKPDPVSINDINDTCNKCPFRSSDKKLLIAHLQQHQPSPQSVFKCYFCPYFVKDENELSQHLLLHGVTEPEDYISKAMADKSPLQDQQSNPSSCSTKRHRCTECPYETNSKSQYMYHEQFHRTQADTPYKCPECNYSVSKRHLLHQHLRVHGIITKRLDLEYGLEPSTSQLKNDGKMDSENGVLEEIPYVWVSAKNEFHKMYKCRYCSYVNSVKYKIPTHENIHFIVFENNDITIYKCLECKFTCDNASRLAEHSKTHGEIYGRIYCPVEDDIPDDEQIAKLRKVIEMDKGSENLFKEEGINENREIKMLFFCDKCPARFFIDTELETHTKLHEAELPNKCNLCEYSVPEENELADHELVHTDEYHTKTKILKFLHNSHTIYRQPRLERVPNSSSSEIKWISIGLAPIENNENVVKKSHDTKHVPKQYCCKLCPAKFLKSSALNYHAALHGGEGDHKCKKCNYAVKNIGNLAKHEILHEKENKASNCDYESGEDMDYKNIPLSGTDLFQRKTEAQKRVLTDKDKLVKPNDHFPPVLQADPQFGYLMHGNPEFIYPTYLKNGRQKEKRYKCHKCPSAFEKREQYKIHLSLHGSKQRYKCELCDYSVKYYANYVQHMRKHQMNDEAQAERKKGNNDFVISENQDVKQDECTDNIKLAIKTMPRGPAKSDFQQFSISDQQTLRLLQRRRSINDCVKDLNTNDLSPTKERKMHMCLLCPYTNQRQDSLNNHYRRHGDTDAFTAANHKCAHCDLVVVQSHFLREHFKTHFNYHKNLTPECFVANEDVSFTIKKIEEEGSEPIDLKLNVQSKIFACNKEGKMYVKITTGELLTACEE